MYWNDNVFLYIIGIIYRRFLSLGLKSWNLFWNDFHFLFMISAFKFSPGAKEHYRNSLQMDPQEDSWFLLMYYLFHSHHMTRIYSLTQHPMCKILSTSQRGLNHLYRYLTEIFPVWSFIKFISFCVDHRYPRWPLL